MRDFFKERHIHPIVAWNRYFDVNHDKRVTLEEFTNGMRTLEYPLNIDSLYRQIDRTEAGYITLNEIDPFSADLWNSFKAWCGHMFTSADEMVAQLSAEDGLDHLRSLVSNDHAKQKEKEKDYDHLGRPLTKHDPRGHGGVLFMQRRGFNKQQFIENCACLGWYNSSEKLLFKALDVNENRIVCVDDILWFDKERWRQLRKNASKSRGAKGNLAVMRQRVQAMRSMQAFLVFLRRKFGFAYRAWRQFLDKDGRMMVNRREFFAACRLMSWNGDVAALWHVLDSDENGFTTFEDLAATEAILLAKFKMWMNSNFTDAKTLMRALNTVNGSHTKLSKSGRLTKELWIEACEKKRCPMDFGMVFDLLDYEGHGSVTLKNLKSLDRWQIKTEWLLAEPSKDAAKEFVAHLLTRYRHAVKAWVKAMDRTHCGKVLYSDFRYAAEHINFKGSVPGAWLALDEDSSGFITLKEVDAAAAETLGKFRVWADEEFGGVVLAMEHLDADESGTLSLKEFKRGLHQHGFRGDVLDLFHSLDFDGKGQLYPSEMFFLDEWELSEILDVHENADVSDSEEEESSTNQVEDEPESKTEVSPVEKKSEPPPAYGSSFRSLQPWPRVATQASVPTPIGKRSRLLNGCGQEARRRVHRIQPLHVQILDALSSKTSVVCSKDTPVCDAKLPKTNGVHLLDIVGWSEQEHRDPSFEPNIETSRLRVIP